MTLTRANATIQKFLGDSKRRRSLLATQSGLQFALNEITATLSTTPSGWKSPQELTLSSGDPTAGLEGNLKAPYVPTIPSTGWDAGVQVRQGAAPVVPAGKAGACTMVES